MTTLAQLSNEDPQAFLFRGLELRQKVVFASKAIDPNNPTYTYEMIQEHFLRAIETGLREEAVRAKLTPFLKRPDIEDEELIAELTRVCAEESERGNKLGKQKVKAASVQNRKKDNDNVASFSEQCFATLNLVQSQLKELSSEVKILKGKQNMAQQNTFPKKGCQKCQEENRRDTCNHCYICGKGSHFWSQCPSKSQKNV